MNHIEYLRKLKIVEQFEPLVIYDIGACVLHWTREAKNVWPNATYILFDAFSESEFLYQESGHQYHIGVLSDTTGKTVRWYQSTIHPNGNSYYRENNNEVFPQNKYSERKTYALDDIVSKYDFPLPDLVKIDVQGCEKDIITGGQETLRHAQRLIVEMQHDDYNIGAPKVQETLPFIENLLNVKCIDPMFSCNGPDADYGFIKGASYP
jgi:FkbM family methyltransferase